ncbi:hypothetical protein Ahy_A10g048121 [Arachis hypogaea]|uniref:Transposase MuDR plant domain-containing protein n=1 Tax=Arachis hypogaea TaxID=3818 RepID=A0A445B4B9_ARAHY|nr:hypothetical protein Ahy_A10g048121 [Arachis hypogaea]
MDLNNVPVRAGAKNPNVESESEEKIIYDYASEEFDTPVSSEDENVVASPDFNEDNEYNNVRFELGMQFATMERFKMTLKDVFVWEGRDCIARCAEETCPWLLYVAKNSATLLFEVKTFNDEHTCWRDYGRNLVRVWMTDKLVKRLATQPSLSPREPIEHLK